MTCPFCQENLEKTIFYGVEIDYCSKCLGLWFEEDELRLAKDKKDETLNWLDIDLWKYKSKLKISRDSILCPSCRLPLYEVNYGNSKIYPHTKRGQGAKGAKIDKVSPRYSVGVKVDICSLCHGIWLSRGEFKKLIAYLRKRKDYEVFNNFAKNLVKEFWEVFTGPEPFKEEILDFLTVLKVLNYRFFAQYPTIAKLINSLPK